MSRDSGHAILMLSVFTVLFFLFLVGLKQLYKCCFFGACLAMFYSVFVTADVVGYLPFMFAHSFCL